MTRTFEDSATQTDEERAIEFATRLVVSYTAGAELLTIELGRRLGFYDVLLEHGSMTVADFAEHTGVHIRYAAEWLGQQAGAAVLDAETTDGDTRYSLPAGHVPVLLDPTSPVHYMGAAPLLAGIAHTLPQVADAYATSCGVEFGAFGDDVRFALGSLNRPGYTHDLRRWVDSMPDIASTLDGGGVVLDAGCGVGWSSIGVARAFPNVSVVGIDLDADSIDDARHHAAEAGLSERITFIHANATDVEAIRHASPDGYELVTVFQALHDMGEPVNALRAFGAVLKSGAAVLVGDEALGDAVTDPDGGIARNQRATSVLHCTPATWAESDDVVNGTILHTHTLVDWAKEAAFEQADILPVEHRSGGSTEWRSITPRLWLVLPEDQVIRYADVGGHAVAWASAGSGPPLFVGGWWSSHLELHWADPKFRSFVSALAESFTVIRYDRPGTGLSERSGEIAGSLQEEADLLGAIVDAIGLDRFHLLGSSAGCPIAAAYAAQHPERIERLVLYGGYAHGAEITPPAARRTLLSVVGSHWGLGSRVLSDLFLPDADNNERLEFAKFQRMSATPEFALASLSAVYDFDVRDQLGAISVPTTVIHRREDQAIGFALGRDLAARIPGAEFVELEGRNHFPWLGDADSAIEAFSAAFGSPVERVRSTPGTTTALSAREREVLSLVAEGLTDAQIAKALVLSVHTVHRHVANARTKLGVTSRAAAAAKISLG